LVVDRVGGDVLHHANEFAWHRHGRTGLVAVDEEDETAVIAGYLREHRVIAVWQAGRRLRIHRVDASQKLPLIVGELDPAAVARGYRAFRHRDADAVRSEILARESPLGKDDETTGERHARCDGHEDLLKVSPHLQERPPPDRLYPFNLAEDRWFRSPPRLN